MKLSTNDNDLYVNNHDVVVDDKALEQQHLPLKRQSSHQR
jgi:hypothetical protein